MSRLFRLLVFLALMTWSFVTLPALDGTAELFSLPWGGVPFGATWNGQSLTHSTKASYGYFFMWFSFVFQLVAMLMHYWMPLDNEMTEEHSKEDLFVIVQDDRLESKMRKEYNQHASQALFVLCLVLALRDMVQQDTHIKGKLATAELLAMVHPATGRATVLQRHLTRGCHKIGEAEKKKRSAEILSGASHMQG